tara:strand:- start:363 stop:986 length:624 start_codon:yes stop_codon:yes gene_type:complete
MFELLPEHLRRIDEGSDLDFYSEPRLVKHIDPLACSALTDYLRKKLSAGSDILDLMSSCVSHLPEDRSYESVVGLGMNEIELQANPQLTEYVVRNLNTNPNLPFDHHSFDACIVTVSVQYLVHPIAVFQDIGRILRPHCPCIISFSNRCFPTKAVAIWHQLSDRGHGELVGHYFNASESFGPFEILDISPNKIHSDPLFVVSAYTNA